MPPVTALDVVTDQSAALVAAALAKFLAQPATQDAIDEMLSEQARRNAVPIALGLVAVGLVAGLTAAAIGRIWR